MRILVDVFCPATSKTYDFWLSDKMSVEQAISNICDEILRYEANDELFNGFDDVMMFSSRLRRDLPLKDTLEAVGVRSGDKLAVL